MLDSTPYGFALELAVAASRREYLDLQQWLSDRFRQLALPFFQVSCGLSMRGIIRLPQALQTHSMRWS